MFKTYGELSREVKENLRGGKGAVVLTHLLTAEEVDGRASMFARIVLEQGQSIGVHDHVVNGEAYVLLRGSTIVTEDGTDYEMEPGDVEFCADGHTHAIRNEAAEPAEIIALILPNRE